MQDLIKQEQFELEVLDRLNSGRFLAPLAFGGGTMMRLCFGLNRFSLDLDFWVIKEIDKSGFFNGLKKYLAQYYTLKDSASKFYTMLFELKSRAYPRSLKIEIRKETRKIATEQAIAYSRYANTQVILKVVSLKEMMQSKIQAFLDRKEIRDVFDIEFLLKKGIELAISPETGAELLKGIE
ncbi:MAG: nucleotidyl transferase AbiEii/AbiGii toxin family protein, partial [Planctomycetota bacterium]